jgi:hypothetical protein
MLFACKIDSLLLNSIAILINIYEPRRSYRLFSLIIGRAEDGFDPYITFSLSAPIHCWKLIP